MPMPGCVVEDGVLLARAEIVKWAGMCGMKLIARAARGMPGEMWERMQKLLLEARFSATIPQVPKLSLIFTGTSCGATHSQTCRFCVKC